MLFDIRKLFAGLMVLSLFIAMGCTPPTDGDGDNDGGDNDTDPVTYELTVDASPPEGGDVDPESGSYEEGEEVEVTATPADGWEFTGWSGDISSSDNPITVTMNEDTELTAEFSEIETVSYELSVEADPSEGGSVDPGSGTFEEGEEVEITATPNAGWEFSGWGGDASSSENPLTVTMDDDKTIVAEFTAITYELTVDVDPSEGGSVDPESGTFEEGEEVEVTASAADGWSFAGWSGDISSDNNPLTFTMEDDTELTATFEEDAKAYSGAIEVDDGTESETVTFGMNQNATDGFDSGLDEEAPPAPPGDAFFAHFAIDGYNLYKDFRPVTKDQTVWELQFDTGEDSITLSWNLDSSDYTGTLTLVDDPDNPSTTIDMDSESSYEITDSSVTTLYIIQE